MPVAPMRAGDLAPATRYLPGNPQPNPTGNPHSTAFSFGRPGSKLDAPITPMTGSSPPHEQSVPHAQDHQRMRDGDGSADRADWSVRGSMASRLFIRKRLPWALSSDMSRPKCAGRPWYGRRMRRSPRAAGTGPGDHTGVLGRRHDAVNLRGDAACNRIQPGFVIAVKPPAKGPQRARSHLGRYAMPLRPPSRKRVGRVPGDMTGARG